MNQLECFFFIEGHVTLERNPRLEYNILLLRLILRYLDSAYVPIDGSTHYATFYTVRLLP